MKTNRFNLLACLTILMSLQAAANAQVVDPAVPAVTAKICNDCYRKVIKDCSEVAPIPENQPKCDAIVPGPDSKPKVCSYTTVSEPGKPPRGKWVCDAPVELSYPTTPEEKEVHRVRESNYHENGYGCFEWKEKSKKCNIAKACTCQSQIIGTGENWFCDRTTMDDRPKSDIWVDEAKISDDAKNCNISWPPGSGTLTPRGADIKPEGN